MAEKAAVLDSEETEEVSKRSTRLTNLESQVSRLERIIEALLEHNHQMRGRMLNYVDKPVLIKDGSFVSLDDGSRKKA